MKIGTKKIAIGTLLGLMSFAVVGGSLRYISFAEGGEGPSATEVRMESLWESDGMSTIAPGEALPDWIYVEDSNKTQVSTAMKVECKLGGSQITYKNPVDISELRREEAFIEIAVAPSIRGEYDYGGLVVRMTDTEDVNNYIEWEFSDNMVAYSQVYAKVSTSTIAAGGGRGTPVAATGARVNMAPFNGIAHMNAWNSENPYANGAHGDYTYPLAFSFDGERYVCYAENYSAHVGNGLTKGYQYIRNLKNATEDANGNIFEGFAADTVYISVGAKNIVGGSAVYYVTKFMGLDMTGEVVDDEAAPILQTEIVEENLTAVVNRPYPIASARAMDVVDGGIESVKVEIIDSEGVIAEVEGSSYTLTKAGNYTLRYSAQDSKGNVKKIEYPLNCVMVAPTIQIDFEEDLAESSFIGQTIAIPNPIVSGGAGTLTYEISVQRTAEGAPTVIEDNRFVPLLAGEYQISYTVTDYLGTRKTVNKFIDVETPTKPIYDSFPILPEIFIAGKLVKFPQMQAYDYTSADKVEGKKAIVEVYVSEVENELGTLNTDYLYTPSLTGNQKKKTIYVTYKTYCEGSSEADIKVYPIQVVKLEQLTDAFKMSEGITTDLKETHIQFATQTENASFEYIVPTTTRTSTIQFTIPSNKSNFKQLNVTLTDSEDPTKTVVFELSKAMEEGKTTVVVNGVEYVMDGSFVKELGSSDLSLNLSKDGKMVRDYKGNVILTLKNFSDGTVFNGFPSKSAYVKFTFKSVSGDSAVDLNQLGPQNINASFDYYSGELYPYEDYTAPIIVLDEETPSSVERYQKFVIPNAQAYDGLDSYTKCFVNVTFEDLNGRRTTLFSNMACETGELFVYANNYGKYRVTYTAQDGNGNIAPSRTFTINVPDVNAPTISLLSEIKQPLKVGEKLVLPEAVVLDLETATTLNVVLIGYNGYMRPISRITDAEGNESFEQITMTGKGAYTVRYIAHDAAYNYTILDYVIVVE